MRTDDRPFYVRWIVANGWAESAGLGTTFVVGVSVAPFFDRHTGVAAILAGALLAVVLGTLLEGVLVGIAQERVLRTRLRALRPWAWTLATAFGAGLAWLAGMVPSTIMALSREQETASMPPEPGAVVQMGLAVALGVIAGPILGVWGVVCVFGPRPPYAEVFCAAATQRVIEAMVRCGVSRLICQTGAMVGPDVSHWTPGVRLMVRLFRRQQPAIAADRAQQESVVKASALEWT